METEKDFAAVSLAYGKDPVHGSLRRTHTYLTHITRVMENVCASAKYRDQLLTITESMSALDVIRQVNVMIAAAEKRLLEEGNVGLYYDSDKARWDFIVRDPDFDGQCRIFDCSFLEYLRVADLHLYDIIIATLSHVWAKIRIPTWDDLLDSILEMMEDERDQWEEAETGEANDVEGSTHQLINAAIEPFRTGPPRKCAAAVYHSYKRLPWAKLARVVEAYNWNTPQKREILAWHQAAEKLCKTVKRTFHYYSDWPDANENLGEFVPAYEQYGMYWDDRGPVDIQFQEYMNNQLGNYQQMPLCYHLSAETPLEKVKTVDPDLRMIDEWMVQSCQVLHYKFMPTYFKGARVFRRWIKEVYTHQAARLLIP